LKLSDAFLFSYKINDGRFRIDRIRLIMQFLKIISYMMLKYCMVYKRMTL